jgi:hypothetical protein
LLLSPNSAARRFTKPAVRGANKTGLSFAPTTRTSRRDDDAFVDSLLWVNFSGASGYVVVILSVNGSI